MFRIFATPPWDKLILKQKTSLFLMLVSTPLAYKTSLNVEIFYKKYPVNVNYISTLRRPINIYLAKIFNRNQMTFFAG